MPSRPVIRDSDDEQSVSPEKLPQIDLNPSDSFFDGIGGSGGVSERDNGVEELHTTAEVDSTEPKNTGPADFEAAMTSPTMSKVRRAQTTMDRMEKKKIKTYGKLTTLDDLGLNRSVHEGSWEKNVIDDAIEYLEEPKRKKRKSHRQEQSQETGGPLLPAQGQNTEPDTSPRISRSKSNNVSDGIDSKTEAAVHGTHQHSSGYTIDTAQDLANDSADELSGELHRVGRNEAEQADGAENVDTARASPSVVTSKRDGESVLRPESYEGLSASASAATKEITESQQENLTSNKSKKREKRKLRDNDGESYDPWADDLELPQEHYKLRRSRFRGGDEVDDIMENIDFSKRPEAAAKTKKKSKLNRRKTTGGAIVVHLDNGDNSAFVEVEEESFEPAKSRASKTPIPSVEEEVELPLVASKLEPDPPKRKRGRPKKSDATEMLSEAGKSAVDSVNAEELPTLTEGKAKKKKRRHLTPPDFSDDEDSAEQDIGNLAGKAQDPVEAEASLELGTHAKEAPLTPSPNKPRPLPLTDKTNVNAATSQADNNQGKTRAEIPKEKEKAPTRHSPLNSSQVRFRVGLSRKARIEPLLRVVKK